MKSFFLTSARPTLCTCTKKGMKLRLAARRRRRKPTRRLQLVPELVVFVIYLFQLNQIYSLNNVLLKVLAHAAYISPLEGIRALRFVCQVRMQPPETNAALVCGCKQHIHTLSPPLYRSHGEVCEMLTRAARS